MTNNWEDLAYRFRWQIAFLLVGLSLAAGGVFLSLQKNTPEIEIISNDTKNHSSELIVEVSGAVNSAGVYRLSSSSRVEDALAQAGGLSSEADSEWVGKYLNRAAYVNDGQKIYIPSAGEQSGGGSATNTRGDETVSEVLASQVGESININTASQSELETLNGIGPVYAQKIIDNRPYSNIDDLSSKSIIPDSTYEKIKDDISVY